MTLPSHFVLIRTKLCTLWKSIESDNRVLLTQILSYNGIDTEDVYALSTIDLKEDEPALLYLRDKYRIPVISFDKEILSKAEGDFGASEFVRKTVGVDNVCERAAAICAGPGGKIVVRKQKYEGMTIAVAERLTDSWTD